MLCGRACWLTEMDIRAKRMSVGPAMRMERRGGAMRGDPGAHRRWARGGADREIGQGAVLRFGGEKSRRDDVNQKACQRHEATCNFHLILRRRSL